MSLPKPYYADDAVTIYHGDCRGIIAEMPSSDVLITDPPYGMKYQSNWRAQRHAVMAGDGSLPVEVVRDLIALARRATYAFCRWSDLGVMPPPRSVLAWIKNNWTSGDLKHEHGRQWEAICFYPGPSHEFVRRIPDVIIRARVSSSEHPTEKPEDLMRALIECNVGDVVLDPFMGSGSTLRAAKDLNRKAIGIEIDERFCEIAARRMRQEVLL